MTVALMERTAYRCGGCGEHTDDGLTDDQLVVDPDTLTLIHRDRWCPDGGPLERRDRVALSVQVPRDGRPHMWADVYGEQTGVVGYGHLEATPFWRAGLTLIAGEIGRGETVDIMAGRRWTELRGQVRHVWYLNHPFVRENDGEVWFEVSAGTPGSEPATVLFP